MKYYAKTFDEWGNKTKLYNKYFQEIILKVDENGYLEIPTGTFAENGYPFKLDTNAIKINCFGNNISELRANNATDINCSYCDIHWLEADKVEILNCTENPLNIIYTPKAVEIECEFCTNLEEINAPKLEKLICSDCKFSNQSIEETDFPYLKTLTMYRTNVKEVKHSKLEYLKSEVNQLENLELPNVENIFLMRENKLVKLDVPNAKSVNCQYSLVEIIICEKAEDITLVENRFLKQIFADKVSEISIYDCDEIELLEIPNNAKIIGIPKTMETIFNLRR